MCMYINTCIYIYRYMICVDMYIICVHIYIYAYVDTRRHVCAQRHEAIKSQTSLQGGLLHALLLRGGDAGLPGSGWRDTTGQKPINVSHGSTIPHKVMM